VALLELLLTAARAGVVASDIFQRIAHGFLVVMVAVRAMDMVMPMLVVMRMIAVGAVDVGFGRHGTTPE
jgi:hypothetical protein